MHLTGNDDHNPLGIPYYPLLITPIDTILLLLPKYQSLRWSTTAQAAENTELPPLTLIIYPPLFWTFGMNVFFNHYSFINFETGSLFTFMCFILGYWVGEWFPKTKIPDILDYYTDNFSAIWLIARLWSKRVRQVIFYGGTFE